MNVITHPIHLSQGYTLRKVAVILTACFHFVQQAAAQTVPDWDDFATISNQGAGVRKIGVDGQNRLFAVGARNNTEAGSIWGPTVGNPYALELQYELPNAQFSGFCSSPTSGSLFVAGWQTVDGRSYWVLLKSVNASASWEMPAPGLTAGGSISCVKADANGVIYSAGTTRDKGGKDSWVVLRSMDDGASWKSIHTSAGNSIQDISVSANGTILLAGSKDVKALGTWTVMRSENFGATWATVDSFGLTKGLRSGVAGMARAGDGTIYITGYSYIGNTPVGVPITEWVTRRSQDGGKTWLTVDRFDDPATTSTTTRSIAIDPAGNIFVLGLAYGSTPGVDNNRGVVRRSHVNSPGTWYISDYIPSPESLHERPNPMSIATDANGVIFAAGSAGPDESRYVLVRALVP